MDWVYALPPSPGYCRTYDYKSVPAVVDLCSGDTKLIYACIPGTCPGRTYAWHVSYLKEILPGTYIEWSGPVAGATNNGFSIPETSDSRTYWCNVTYTGNTVSTGSVLVRWNSTSANINKDLSSNEIVCLNDEVRLSFGVEGYNSYTWKVKPSGSSTWTNVPDQNNYYYYFYPALGNNNDQYKCVASNACWDQGAESNAALLTVNNLPEVNLGADTHICEGERILLGVGHGGMISYNWSTGESTETIYANNAGTYTLTVTNSDNCQNSDAIGISVDPALTPVNLETDHLICLDSSIILDAGPGYDSYLWNTMETTQTISVNETGEYRVEVSKLNNVCRERDSMNLTVIEPYSKEKICIVTIYENSGNNLIVWEKSPDQGILSYNIYRENDLIANIPYDALSIFEDTIANPETRPFLYYISVIDTCTNESQKSPYHKPMFLQYVSSFDGVNLQWSKYEVEDGYLTFTDYELWRGSDSVSLSPLAENIPVQVGEYTDDDPMALKRRYYYRIAGILDTPCLPTGSKKAGTDPYHHSLSNMDDNKQEEPDDSTGVFTNEVSSGDIMVYPNPMVNYATIKFPNSSGESYQLFIWDLAGKLVFTLDNILNNRIEIALEELHSGLYLLELRGSKVYRKEIMLE